MFVRCTTECLFLDNGDKFDRRPLIRNKSSYCINYPYVYFFGGRRNYVCLKDFWQFDIGKLVYFSVNKNNT